TAAAPSAAAGVVAGHAQVVAADEARAAVAVGAAGAAHAAAAAARGAALHAGRALGLAALLGRRAARKRRRGLRARRDDRHAHRRALRAREAERAPVGRERDDVVLDGRLEDVAARDLVAVASLHALHLHAAELPHAVAAVVE